MSPLDGSQTCSPLLGLSVQKYNHCVQVLQQAGYEAQKHEEVPVCIKTSTTSTDGLIQQPVGRAYYKVFIKVLD